ncbi:MAG: hypothetical protein JW996_02975, partial [Candidatus Cloacimonetes bacterium]|nr:hypothetical protein [Candidatus Cloacimonadota bacterium]
MKKTERMLSAVLNILALFNIELLFLDLIRIGQEQLYIYNRFAITILLIHIAVEFIRNGFTLARLRDFIPDLLFIGIGLFVIDSDRVFEFYLLGRQAFIFIRNLALREEKGRLFEKLSDNPPILVLISFFIAIFLGTLMLLLPIATVAGRETSVIDALFTSTSATCVTGLIVQDTGTHFTLWGQIIIAFLIQIGGLGIMTVSSAFAIILGQRMTVKSESMIQNVIGESSKIDMINLVKNIVIVTFTFELIGAIMFFYTFHSRLPSVNMAIFHSIFHSISAFCNAGFCLYSDSLTAYRSNFNINFVVTSLIILGGIGFPVMVDIRQNLSGKFRLQRLSLHSKIVLTTTLILIVVGAVCFFITEYNSEMKGFRFSERLYSSYFQSVTTRTAGFNTIDNANLSKASILVSVLLMFIG